MQANYSRLGLKNWGRPGWAVLVLWLALALLTGCAHLKEPDPGQAPLVYQPQGPAPAAVLAWAPAVLVHNPQQAHNRLGRPQASRDAQGGEQITVNPDQPAIFHQALPFHTARGSYTNLVYRLHFPATPASLLPFFIGAGHNMGLILVVTLDAHQRPVLLTTVGTCGCYVSFTATDHLDPAALPPGWGEAPQEIYGERLPARLALAGRERPRLFLSIRPGEHRVMDLGLLPAGEAGVGWSFTPAALLPAEELQRLPLPGGGQTSFFYQGGILDGHVKGAWKPWETLILGLVSWDAVVGMDKAYPHPHNPFYTSLKPWARAESDMRDFARFLAYHGWRL